MFNNTRDNQNVRSTMYKKTVDSELSRRKREEISSTLRKNAREEQITKRRQITTNSTNIDEIAIPEQLRIQFKQYEEGTMDMKLKNLPNLKNSLYSNEEALVYCALEQFRKLLSHDNNPPIKEVMEIDIIGKLNELVQCGNTKVQCEAAWAITNIASGKGSCAYLQQSGTIAVLFNVLSNEKTSLDAKEQCVWALANIAGESHEYRDLLLDMGMMDVIIALGQLPIKFDFLQTIVWAISNLCRGSNPLADFKRTSVCLPFINQLLDNSDIVEILAEVCWTVSYLAEENSDDPIKHIPSIVEAGVIQRIVELMGSEESQIYSPALRAVGNILTGDKHATRACMNAGVLTHLNAFIQNREDGKPIYRGSIRKEACWSASNIAAGSQKQIDEFVQEKPLMISLLRSAKTDVAEVKREIFFALTNATNGSKEAVNALVRKYDILKVFRSGLRNSQESKTQKIILEAISTIIKLGEDHVKKTGMNPYLELMVEYNYEEIITTLLEQTNNKIVTKLSEDILEYFETDLSDGENYEPNENFDFNRSTTAQTNTYGDNF